MLYKKFELEHNMLYLEGEKECICGLAEVYSQFTKNLESANRKSAKCHFWGMLANLTNY
jgi:hypothetical protein